MDRRKRKLARARSVMPPSTRRPTEGKTKHEMARFAPLPPARRLLPRQAPEWAQARQSRDRQWLPPPLPGRIGREIRASVAPPRLLIADRPGRTAKAAGRI